MRYFFRAETQVAKIHPSEQLAWLSSRDEAERAAWVELHRATSMTLGAVIKELFVQREYLWVVHPEKRWQAHEVQQPVSDSKRARSDIDDSCSTGWSRTMRDGRLTSMAWNRGKCVGECPDGAMNVCARIVRNGSCGAMDHKAGAGKGCTRAR